MANSNPKKKWGMGGPIITPMPSNKPGDVQCCRGHRLLGYPAKGTSVWMNCYEYEIEHPDGKIEPRVLCRTCDRIDTDAAQVESDNDIDRFLAAWERIQEYSGDAH